MNTQNNLESDVKSLIKIALQKHNSGQLEAAISYYQQILQLKPDYAEVYACLAETLEKRGKLSAAMKSYQQALKLKPDYAEAYCNLGNLLNKQGKLEAATAAYQKALNIKPNLIEVYCNLGNVLKKQGKREASVEVYQKALKIQPDLDLAKFFICINQLPIIYENFAEIELRRNNYQRHLQDLSQHYKQSNPQELKKAADVVGLSQPFYLAYQGLNDRDLQQIYGDMIVHLMSNRYPQWSQDIPLPSLQPNEKIRIGFVSGFFYKHSVWKIPMKGWVENLDRSQFELFGYYTNINLKKDGETVKAAKAFDKFTQGPLALEKWAEIIQQDKLHVLIFPEFGMDPTTVQLGCLKLAPAQVVFGGHPETSGLSTIDYHLSSDLMEPDNAQEYYTEQLIRLPNMAVHYTPLVIQPQPTTKSEIGIAEDEIMFWSCQSLYKYLPQHDDVFPRIAQDLDKCKFVFIQDQGEGVTKIFRQRLKMVFEEFGLNYQNYCIFLPPLKREKFAGVTAIADVFLDNIGWSGNNTTMESTAFNIPIVTYPQEMMRGRHVLGILKMMGIEETIASSKEEYVQIAIRLGRDAEYRQYISDLIAQNKHKLYNDLKPVRALEGFLFDIVGKPKISTMTNVTEILRLAIQEHRENHLEQAEQAYREVLSIQPNHPDVLFGLGMVAQQAGKPTEAEQYLRLAVQAQPDSIKLWFALGNLHQTQGQLPEAISAYRQALKLRPDVVSIYNNLGYALQQQSEWDEAIACYQTALDIQPGCAEAEANLGNALYASGKLQSDQSRHYAKINYMLGVARKNKGDMETALIYFQQAVALNPDLAKAQLELGIYLRDQQGQIDKALDCFKKAQEAATKNPVSKFIRNSIYEELGQTYQKRVALHPEIAEAQLKWGAYLRDGKNQIEEALVCLKKAQRTKPTWEEVYVELGRTYQNQGNIDKAVNAFQKYLNLVNPEYAQRVPKEVDNSSEINLEQYLPPPITFGEITIGTHRFPSIPAVADREDNRPFWSVVIPAVNRPEYFPECLASVLAQWTGAEDMEILVLDNGSNPPLFDLVSALGKGIIRYYRFPETVPLQENWNTMIALARGDWIFLLQHDDYVLPEFFERFRDSLKKCPDSVGAAFTDYQNIDEHRKVIFTQNHGLKDYQGIVKDWVTRIGTSCPLSPPSLVIRRAAYERLGGYKLDLPYTCDWEFYKRVGSFYDWWHEPGILAHYRQYANSLTTKDSLNGMAGKAHRRAIEISHTYLPIDLREEITQKSQIFHFHWCLTRAAIVLNSNAIDGAMKLVQEALLIDNSETAAQKFLTWIDKPEFKPLKHEFALRLLANTNLDKVNWTLDNVEMIKRLEL